MVGRVVVYERAGCHLCDLARPAVVRVCEEFGETPTFVDVDAVGADVLERHSDFVPVVEVDGRRVSFWRVDPVDLRAALAIPDFAV